MADKSQKTEKPTAQRRKKAVKDGQVPRSADVTAWLTVLSFSFLAPMTVDRVRETFQDLVGRVPAVIADPEPGPAVEVLKTAFTGTAGAIAPVLLAAAAVALVGGAVQTKGRFFTKRLKPKFEHLNIGKGLKRMFSGQAAWNLAKTLLKFAVLGVIAYLVMTGVTQQIMGTGTRSLSSSVGAAVGAALKLLRVAACVGLLVAAVDWVMERRRVEKGMRMSRDEIKRETRQSEGDPYQKGALRGRQREMSRNRMMSSVATADVVLVNPTHVAVALKYEPGTGAPRVVAKGAGHVAARIREEAEKHRLPMVADIPLARTIYNACEVGQEIPVDLYDAVARILAFIMALRRRGSVAGLHHIRG